MRVKDSSGRYYELAAKPFAGGGEGSIYKLNERSDLVAKVYRPDLRTQTQLNKLNTMISSVPAGKKDWALNGQVAWPVSLIFDANNKFIGFLMKRVDNAAKINILYSYDSRNDHPWKWYIQAAQNLCAAVNSVHTLGHCIGDLNPANICVDAKAIVTLVDTDSYHIKAPNGTTYRCNVCMPPYVPSEIHKLMKEGVNLRTTTRKTFSIETDLFALAVHVFALLMNGSHPYACTVPGGGSASQFGLVPNIINAYFPFVKSAERVDVPKYAPYLGILPEKIKRLFIRAFSPSQGGLNPSMRPSAVEWYDALEELDGSLKQCPSNLNHQYWNGNTECPWCAIERKMGRILGTKSTSTPTTKQPPKQPITQAPYPPKPTPPKPTTPTPTQPKPKTGGGTATISSGAPWALTHSGSAVYKVLLLVGSIIFWGILNVLALRGINMLPQTAWYWSLLRLALIGLAPSVPMIAAHGLESALPGNLAVYDVFEYFSYMYHCYNPAYIIVGYGGLALFFTWGTGIFNMVLWPILLCAPGLFVSRICDALLDD